MPGLGVLGFAEIVSKRTHFAIPRWLAWLPPKARPDVVQSLSQNQRPRNPTLVRSSTNKSHKAYVRDVQGRANPRDGLTYEISLVRTGAAAFGPTFPPNSNRVSGVACTSRASKGVTRSVAPQMMANLSPTPSGHEIT